MSDAELQLLPVHATFVRELDGWNGDARLYRLSEMIRAGYEPWEDGPDERPLVGFVIVSAVDHFATETYIFPANHDGTAVNMQELPGSFRGDCDHRRAIEGAGWVLDEGEIIEASIREPRALNP